MSKSIKNIENLDSMNQNDLMKLLRVKEMENERMKKSVANLMTEERNLLKDLEEEEQKKAAENSNMVHGFAFDTFRIVEKMKLIFEDQFKTKLDHPDRDKKEVEAAHRRLRTAAEQGKRSAEQARHALDLAKEELEKAQNYKLKGSDERVQKAKDAHKAVWNQSITICRIPSNDLISNISPSNAPLIFTLTLQKLEELCLSSTDVEITLLKELKRISERKKILELALTHSSDIVYSDNLIREQGSEVQNIMLIKKALQDLVGKKGIRKAIVEVREELGAKTFRKGLSTK
ncbi:hypothetical protein TrST_g236 [Triparma strigata]|uniref:Uncharacterized protein n=1 Tax=Triparma strigata TaxID=1606541 RepID=A0A9W7BBA5_9STRA|nr:hypothetical protein TrST_g236 [Triparma strigata]